MKGIRTSVALTPAAAIVSALATFTCCLPWGIGAALGTLGLSVVFAKFQVWFFVLSVALLFIGLFQVLRKRPGCLRRSRADFGVALGAFLVMFLLVAARHQTPSGQPPLANVTEHSLTQLKQEFNAHQDSERVVLLLSPTCPVCVQGSSVVNSILSRHPGKKIHVLAIWEPILLTDWNRPTSAVLDRLSDGRAVQWWDEQHLIAGLLKASAGENPICCKRNGTLWDVIAVYPPGAQWNEVLPAPEFISGPVVRGAPNWEAQLGHS